MYLYANMPKNFIAQDFSYKKFRMQRITHRRIRISWLLLLVYIPMMITVTFHRHSEAQKADSVFYCQDCAHHVHHDGHLFALQHEMHECVLCQMQYTPYLAPTLLLLAVVVVFHYIIRRAVCPKCKLMANDALNTRAPPYYL